MLYNTAGKLQQVNNTININIFMMGKFGCGDCSEEFTEFKDLESHMEDKHDYSDEKMKNKYFLVVHLL